MTLSIDELFTPATADEWLATELSNAETLELKTTSWQSGGMARTILSIMSNIFAQGDGIISIMAHGGFLDFAANGQVTFTAANGQTVTQKVTPDPSIASENPNGTPGWLDLLASSVYNVTRIGATYASNVLAIVNRTSNTYGPFAVGTYHVTNPSSDIGYSNSNLLTINPKTIVGTSVIGATNSAPIIITTSAVHGLTGTEIVYISDVLGNTAANGFWSISVLSPTTFALNGSTGNGSFTSGGTVNICTTSIFQADIKGPTGTSATGGITETVTVLSGVSVFNIQSFVGSNWENNQAVANRCRLKLQSISPNGPKGAYSFFALSADQFLSVETPPVQLSTPATRVLEQLSPTTGVLTTVVANAGGSVSGVSNLPISNATNATPIVITTTSPHGLATGDFASITGVIGNTGSNGTWIITKIGASTFSLNNSVGNAAYASGGVVEGGDLGQIDKVIQQHCVPDNVTAITVSANGFNAAIIATVEVPQANVSIYTAAVQTALALYFASLPIGGVDGFVEYENIIGVLFAAGSLNGQASYVRKISGLTLNGVAADLAYPSSVSVASLSPTPAITVIGV